MRKNRETAICVCSSRAVACRILCAFLVESYLYDVMISQATLGVLLDEASKYRRGPVKAEELG
jgi:hypothetical protein